jgi:hypothetical protein
MILFLATALAGAPQTEGVRPSAPDADAPRIINGEDATVDIYPMTGALLLDADVKVGGRRGHLRTLLCSSTLIAPDVVLLAAHCIDDFAVTRGMAELSNKEYRWTRQVDLTAFDGSGTPDWPVDAIKAWDWVYHDEWDMQSLQIGLADNHDIALVFLDTPVNDVGFAYLPTVEEAAQIVLDADVDVVGWGQQVASDNPWDPPAPGTFGVKKWGTSYINDVAAFEMQIGGFEEDVRKCHGDSGGPTFLEVQTESPATTRLIGVTSHAYDTSDCDSKGGVDSRVDYHLGWIDDELRARCADGTRSWCVEAGIPAIPEPPPPVEDVPEEEAVRGCACAAAGTAPSGVVAVGIAGMIAALGRLRRGRATRRA